MFIGKYNRSAIVTYAGVIFSLVGILNAINKNIKFAMIFLVLAGICDALDGKFANLFKRNEEEKEFGGQIDSLADMVNFIIAPVVIAICMGLNQWYHIVVYSFYILAGITRIGYFNISSVAGNERKLAYYTGLPATYVAPVFAAVWFFLGELQTEFFPVIYAVMTVVLGLMFISNVKVRKNGIVAKLVLASAAVALIVLISLKGA